MKGKLIILLGIGNSFIVVLYFYFMVGFNADGSLKLPELFEKSKRDQENRMLNTRCVKIRKNVLSFSAPKKCSLSITLSRPITDIRFVDNIFGYFIKSAETPMKIVKNSDKEFEIVIETSFKRCTECNSLIGRYREFMDGSLINDKGNCSFEQRSNFHYEDYFDD